MLKAIRKLPLFLALLLLCTAISPLFLSRPVSAAQCSSGDNCYFVSLIAEDGTVIIGREDNQGFTGSNDQVTVAIIYRLKYKQDNGQESTAEISTGSPGVSQNLNNPASDWEDSATVDLRVVDENDLFYVKQFSWKDFSDKYQRQTLRISNSDKKILASVDSTPNAPASIQIDDLSQIDYGETRIITNGVGEVNRETPFLPDDLANAEIDNTTHGTVGEDVTDQYDPNTNADGSVSNSNVSEADVACSRAAGGLSWAICSAGQLVADGLADLYTVLESYLSIRASLLSTKDETGAPSGIYRGWSMFRDIANIFFVIYLLVVILSQLTGVGIDNYGIKKALPRLVVAAVLINLSFIICQLAVDLSNILGASINGLFESLAKEITFEQTGVYAQTSVSFGEKIGGVGILTLIGIGGLLIAGGGVAGIAGSGVGMTLGLGAVALLFTILGAVLSAFIAVLGLWLILVIRQSVIVIGIVCAPLAFASYSLDGTKKSIFDPWFKIMKAMLILYPICGFVVGAGLLASRIMLTTGNGPMTVVIATVVQIGPYFFIPKLFRSSLNAVGKLSGIYNKFTSGVGGRVKGAYDNNRLIRQNRAMIGANKQRGVNLQDVNTKAKIALLDAKKQPKIAQSNRRVGALVGQIQREQEAAFADQEIATLEAKRNNGQELSEAEQDRLSKAYMEKNRQASFKKQLARTSSEQYAERVRTAEEERQRNFDELAFISDLQQVGSANFAKYSGGENTEAIVSRIYELLQQESLNQEEDIELNGLSRYLAMTPGKEGALLEMFYDDFDPNGKQLNTRRLSDDALLRFNQMRLKNHDVNAMLGRKDRTTALYLSDLTAGKAGAQMSTEQIGAQYAQKALTDVADIAAQSAKALRQYSGHLSRELVTQALENRTILSDVDKQNALKNNAAFQVAEARENLLRIQHASNQKILVDEELKLRIGKGTTSITRVEIPSGSDTDILRQSGLDLSSMSINPTTGNAEGTFNKLYAPQLNDGSEYAFKGHGQYAVDPSNNHVVYSERFLRKGAQVGSADPNDYLERRFDASTGLDLPIHELP